MANSTDVKKRRHEYQFLKKTYISRKEDKRLNPPR